MWVGSKSSHIVHTGPLNPNPQQSDYSHLVPEGSTYSDAYDRFNQREQAHMVSVLAALRVHDHILPKQQPGKAKQWLLLPFIATLAPRR